MSIQNAILINFTVFEHMQINLSDGVNVIIGKNGTGKTHFLKAVYAACAVTENDKAGQLRDYFVGRSVDATLCRDEEKKYVDVVMDFSDNSADGMVIQGSSSLPLVNDPDERIFLDRFNHRIIVPQKSKYKAVFIPVKDMLTHAKGLLPMKGKYSEFPFDKTLTDIIEIASQWTVKTPPEIALSLLPVLEKIVGGKIILENGDFCIQRQDGHMMNFAFEAEGFKKFGLLWRLLMNESITEGSILLWDEPEANINPEHMPVIVDCLLELARHNVQVIISTHNYILAKYFDVKRKEADKIRYHSFYMENGAVQCETKDDFASLKQNSIMTAFNELLDDVYNLDVGD